METLPNKKTLIHHAERLSDKLTQTIHASHRHKVLLHTRKNKHVVKFPLLLGIILFLLFPIFVGIALTIFLYYEGNLLVEKEE